MYMYFCLYCALANISRRARRGEWSPDASQGRKRGQAQRLAGSQSSDWEFRVQGGMEFVIRLWHHVEDWVKSGDTSTR